MHHECVAVAVVVVAVDDDVVVVVAAAAGGVVVAVVDASTQVIHLFRGRGWIMKWSPLVHSWLDRRHFHWLIRKMEVIQVGPY